MYRNIILAFVKFKVCSVALGWEHG